MNEIKNYVRFKGPFNQEFKDEFPGRDLAEFIVDGLRKKGQIVKSIEHPQPHFSVFFIINSVEFTLEVFHSAFSEDYWEICCPEKLASKSPILDKSEEAEIQDFLKIIDEILCDDATITDIKWYECYETLIDDYPQTPAARRYKLVCKYIEKLTFPLCLTGLLMILVGNTSYAKDSLLVEIGTILFLLPIVAFLALLPACLVVGLLSRTKNINTKKQKGNE